MGSAPHRHHICAVMIRILIGLLATCVIAALLWWALQASDPTLQTANSLQGERWYRLTLADQAVGYYRSQAQRGQRGQHEFHTELRFALSKGQPVTVRESYVFASAPPFALLQAAHSVNRRSGWAAVHIDRRDDALIASRSGSDRASSAEQTDPHALDWDYSLAEYLAFESWIRAENPQAGASLSVTSPDLDNLTLASEVFELVSAGASGYQVRKRSLLDDTLIELDSGLIPVRFELAGVFDLQRSSKREALSARTTLHKSSYRLPLDQPLRRPKELRRLVLRAQGPDAHEFPEQLELSANPLVPAGSESYLDVNMNYPVDHPRLQQTLAEIQLEGLSDNAKVMRLLQHVHGFLVYDDRVPARGVLELLDEPRGDCTEFADLFTSLARAAGLPARTVVGMAYSDDPEPALAFHAWNQVLVNGVWQAIDPTWNQRQVDATHWPLPSNERQAMLLLTGQIDVQLQVMQADYEGAQAPGG